MVAMPSTSDRRTPLARARRILVDPRLLIGIVLVIASVAGMVGIVLATDHTREVVVARVALAPGDVVRAGDLTVVGAGLGPLAEHYLTPDEVPAEGVVVTRVVVAGEAVPRSAVGEARGVRLATIVVEARGLLPSAVTAGSTVDLWAAPPSAVSSTDAADASAPVVLVEDAIVVRLIEDDALVATGEVTGVELLIPRSRIARVLAARAADTDLAVVPSGIPLAP